jgi:hypothetical protein
MPKVADLYAELGLKKDKFDKGMKDAEGGPSRLGKAFNVAGVAIAASLTLVAAGLMAVGKQSIAAWDAQEKANQGLLVALKGRRDMQQALLEQAGQMQKTTLFEDDAIIQAQKMLAVMGLSVVQIKDLIPLIADFSTATGMDMAQAANLVGKAIATGTNALGRYGVELDSTMSKTEKANAIMTVFTERYGNQAEAAARAGASGLQQLNKAWGEIQETIGAKIGPFMAALSSLLAGKMLDATSGAAATGMQKTINEYVNADAAGREKVISGLKSTLAEYTRLYKEAKANDDKVNRGHYAGQMDVVREALETIEDLNKESNVKIVDDTAKTTKAIKELWLEATTVPQFDYGVSQLTPKGMPGISSMDLASDTTGMGPIEFNYEELATATEKYTQFIADMNSAMSQFTADFIGTFAEGIGQLMSGNIGLDQFFNTILSAFGGFISQMGKMLIAYGIGMEAFKKAFTNPFAAIAAGVALTVIGGLISGLASKGPSMSGSSSGMSGGGIGGGGGDYRPWLDGGNGGGQLVAVVKGSDLLFTLERAQRNSGRVK